MDIIDLLFPITEVGAEVLAIAIVLAIPASLIFAIYKIISQTHQLVLQKRQTRNRVPPPPYQQRPQQPGYPRLDPRESWQPRPRPAPPVSPPKVEPAPEPAPPPKPKPTTFDEIEDGPAFEAFMADLLERSGFTNVTQTKASGDQGVDVLAEKDGVKYAVQCKLYSNPVGNKAVQEAATGKAFYDCHVAIVATNSTFTASAIEVANKVGVVLWDGARITKMQEAAVAAQKGPHAEAK